MSLKLSKRIQSFSQTPIRKFEPLALSVKQKGIHVFHLNIGEPDLPTDPVFLDAIKQRKTALIEYPPTRGVPELLKAISDYFTRDGYPFDEREILVTHGATDGLLYSMIAITDPGDEILTPEPFYPNYVSFTRQIGVDLKPIATYADEHFRLPKSATLESLITPKTKGILISNPSNPSGRVYTREELQTLLDVAKKYQLWVISDELYRPITFDGKTALSLAAFHDHQDHVILVDSVSKRYSACGARIGAILSKNQAFMTEASKLAQTRLGVSLLDQIGAAALYRLPPSYLKNVQQAYEGRRNTVLQALKAIPNIQFETPEGAFYVMVTLPIDDSEHFTQWMVSEFSYQGKTVLVTPGADFYLHRDLGKKQIRIAYILNPNDLKEAIAILGHALKQYLARPRSS